MKRILLLLLLFLSVASSARAEETLAVWHAYRGDEKIAPERVPAKSGGSLTKI